MSFKYECFWDDCSSKDEPPYGIYEFARAFAGGHVANIEGVFTLDDDYEILGFVGSIYDEDGNVVPEHPDYPLAPVDS